MGMTLSEIEEKAQELVENLLAAGKQEALLLGIQIEGLRDLTQIMAMAVKQDLPIMETVLTPDYTLPPCPSTFQLSKEEYYVCVLPFEHKGQHRGGGMWWAGPGNGSYDGQEEPEGGPEPTKPAADRLHELVSYFRSESEQARRVADQHREDSGLTARKYPDDYEAAAYDDAATKLQEILQEGGI